MTESSEYQFNSICVFCGSSPGANPVYLEAANEVGKYLADNGITLIYGGGQLGLMGAIADATLANGGKVIGVIPDALAVAEVAHARLTELHVVKTMHERKALMAELSDAFIALPGGFGTFEEYCEMLTWGQLDIHRKPVGLLNVNNYFDPLIQLFDHANSEGFIHDR
ncbi:MAG: TIGR00730 family Rossman fold protein, partial [Chthonomonadales bacterium]